MIVISPDLSVSVPLDGANLTEHSEWVVYRSGCTGDLIPSGTFAEYAKQNTDQSRVSQFGIGRQCIIRTYSAGVHFGTVADRAGTEVLLKDARRIWYWDQAFTLNAIANNGAGNGSKISAPIAEILLTEAIEVIPCAEAGAKWLTERIAHEA